MKSSRNFQTELNNLKNEMLSHIRRNLPIVEIDERIDVITSNWDGDFLKTVTLKSISKNGECITDDYNYDLADVCLYDLAWLCNYYCKK